MLKPSIKTITVKNLLTFIMLAAAVMMIVIAFNFRVLSHKIVEAEANAIAEVIKAGLTSHMKAGIMDKRDYFLNEISSVNEVKRISIVRSPAVDRQFGVGRYEKPMDGLSNEVFQSRQPKYLVEEFSSTPTIRAIIPYIASSQGELNCLNCHQVAEGVVLGVVDIELDVSRYRNMASWILMVLVIFSLFFTVLIVHNTFRTVQVYVKEPLESLVERARVAYKRHQPVCTDSFHSLEFESVANEINLFNADIIANQEQLKQMNSSLASLNDEIEDTLRETVFTMGVIEEKRSKETNNHTKRVTEYSRLLASQCGLPEAEIELIVAAAPLHDVGKLGIPDRILLKPGKLTPDEFEIMRNHSSIGFAMLAHSKRDILKAAAIIAHQHHEKWDGSGYPQGLKGDDIHIYGRIVALADVFDALSTRRPYKEPWSVGRITDWFEAERGRHFDPMLVDILFETIDEFIAIGEQYSADGDGRDDTPAGQADFVAEGI
jgi:response regulator RpfG family c-di-GMP phosphodiesterase